MGSRSMVRLFAPGVLLVSSFAGAAPAPAAVPAPPSPSPSQVLRRSDQTLPAGQMAMPVDRADGLAPDQDRTLAPYLSVIAEQGEGERLPLKETSADVQIAGSIARVKVHQRFENGGPVPIEAVYVFPASTRAAVHGMRMKIGTRTVEARIERRAEAREAYAAARREGKRTSLLEQQRANVFTMNVANIMPGDRIDVELDYSELLVPTDAVYEFVYPTVVGPRYGGGADPVKDRWIASPYQPAGQREAYRFDVKVHLETGIAIKELSSPSHPINARYPSADSAEVTLASPGGGDRDYVLRYRLAGDRIESGLLLWESAGQGNDPERFFALMLEPPQRPTPGQIPPREYIFLLDVSGSMHGYPLDTAKRLMKSLLGNLRPGDWFNLALFSGASYLMSPEGSVPATAANIQLATELVTRQGGGGGTELMGGLRAAYAVPRRGQGVSRTVVVVTDGYVGVEAQAFKFIRDQLDQANLFAFGIGSSVNRALIEGMARAGRGEPYLVLHPDRAAAEAERLRAAIQSPVLTGIKVAMNGFAATELAPAHVPDLMAGRPVVVFGKYQGEPTGRIEVTGQTGGGQTWRGVIDVGRKAIRPANAPLRALWARSWVETLDDQRHLAETPELTEAITALGLRYQLLTPFTSFLAVDSQVVNAGGQSSTVAQPLPLPAGVSEAALGMMASAASVAPAPAAGGLGGGTPTAAPLRLLERRARPPSAPLNQAATPSPALTKQARRVFDREDDAAPTGELRFLVLEAHPTALGDTAALATRLDQALALAAGSCGAAEGILRLRLTIDPAGRVVGVERVSGPAGLAACLQGRLRGLTTGTRAQGAARGTYAVTVKTVRLR